MRFDTAALSPELLWSSPFVRWQGSLADVTSTDLAVAVTSSALAARSVDTAGIGGLVVGQTIPQPNSFYLAPWLASRIGLPGMTGPHIAQACATSVACIVAAAQNIEQGAGGAELVVTTDRTSNGPLMIHPRGHGAGGSPSTEHWVLDSFAADPNTARGMLETAENVAAEGRFGRTELDELTLLRTQQYGRALENDRAFQRRYLQAVEIPLGKGRMLRVGADEGVHPTSAEGLAGLKPVRDGGVVTFGTQTHPADGCAGALVGTADQFRRLTGRQAPVARLLSAAFARTDKACMPKAATTAAQSALAQAGIDIREVAVVVTHNPFAVNDLWFARQTGFPLERMNPFGCSLVYGHPQAPTGQRAIAELVHALVIGGGGIGVFTGCAAGDTGAALVLRVD
jgi:acetyl-CoA C-acetyltransferase